MLSYKKNRGLPELSDKDNLGKPLFFSDLNLSILHTKSRFDFIHIIQFFPREQLDFNGF